MKMNRWMISGAVAALFATTAPTAFADHDKKMMKMGGVKYASPVKLSVYYMKDALMLTSDQETKIEAIQMDFMDRVKPFVSLFDAPVSRERALQAKRMIMEDEDEANAKIVGVLSDTQKSKVEELIKPFETLLRAGFTPMELNEVKLLPEQRMRIMAYLPASSDEEMKPAAKKELCDKIKAELTANQLTKLEAAKMSAPAMSSFDE